MTAALLLAGCGGSAASGPGPGSSTAYFSPAGVDMGGTGAHPGQVVVFPAVLVASRPEAITLVSASLVAVPGYRLPRLTHLSVLSGCGLDLPTFALGWPATAGGTHARQTRFTGARVWAGARNGCYSAVLYGVQSDTAGPFAVGGLRLRFKAASGQTSAVLYNGGFVWVHSQIPARQKKAFRRQYLRENNQAFKVLDDLAHAG